MTFMTVKDIGHLNYSDVVAKFFNVASTPEFSAVATCGVGTLSFDRRRKLMNAFKKAGLTVYEEEVNYAVSTIANRLINRE